MNKRILIIDDDEDILDILHIIFRDEGFNVVVSNTGEAADHIHIISPDLILLDVRIAGSAKRGDQICAEIKARYPGNKLPVVLVSAETDLEMLANQCGADFYVKKPFDIYELLSRVKAYLA
ncbi:two-component system alkaline phosphatase synthesis response regulator PhoP/two-component system response regulator MtrA [Mucilaginibacter oryzae]|uniref:Two-component system alkaline phosphatase synthesis response regulator PhoP/two-component system response regulator MtrA n=1 Tax=Mucilaginibacter oryzae TaxID=468058 RepID=A0A316H200_9SPHI|nr:response regulator [Mucilaginibacter oryzae]PWK71473.1 two-component system alkaline phosphatase synthesis response regulator PhoP/two-component system response regulator MtrA [Mucilaginibacter oryzae]